jgi:hypothetical protein
LQHPRMNVAGAGAEEDADGRIEGGRKHVNRRWWCEPQSVSSRSLSRTERHEAGT